MSQIIKAVSPETLRSWGVSPDAQINYYDGKVLVIDDSTEDVGIGTMAKFGCSLIFGVAVFTHAPLVGVTLFAYAGYKVLSTVGSMYSGNNDLASRIERDLGLDTPSLPAAQDDFDNRFDDAVATYQPGNQTRLGAVEAKVSSDASSPAGETAALPANKTELLARLKVECPVLLKLVKSQPIRAVGTQRTGKTTLVKKLALLRSLALPNHKVIASTPHYEPDNPYPSVFQVVGWKSGKRDYPAIARQWEAMATRIENGDRSSITTVWDEFGLFDKVMEEETLTSVLTSSLREATKHGEYPVFIVHGETQAFLPGSRGLVTVFLSSTVRVETIGELVPDADGLDEMRPTGKFRVTWLDGTKEEGQIPAWLSEEVLISLLPNSVARNSQPETYQEKAPDREPQNKPASPVDQLNKMFQSEAFTPAHEEGSADDETAIEQSGTVIEISSDLGSYIKSRPDVTLWNVRSIKRANKKFRRHDDATLMKAFQILALSDRGEWDGESFKPV